MVIKNVAFDSGGVLIFTNNFIDYFIKNLLENNIAISKTDFLDSLSLAESGTKKLSEVYKNIDGFENLWIEALENNAKYNFELLNYYKNVLAKRVDAGILSNVDSILAKSGINKNLYKIFDSVILSCNIGYAKPCQEIYYEYLKKVNLPPEKVLFIEDKQEYIDVANDIGFETIHFINTQKTIEEIKKIILN
ncbi:HAD-IA family hydrolase [candidate division WWE3 bacterium]|nr:HAD-IA family hydrolase [candidate division WWE3 bacterium]